VFSFGALLDGCSCRCFDRKYWGNASSIVQPFGKTNEEVGVAIERLSKQVFVLDVFKIRRSVDVSE
jgi:hypothetical protein